MPTEWIHHPWDAPKPVLEAAGVELGVNYPKPVIEMDTARERLDDAVAMMWELDRAERAAKLNGSAEVVEDNLLSMQVMDIPKVVVKKSVSVDASSRDQRVPSVQNLKSSVCEKGSKKLDGKRPEGDEMDNLKEVVEASKMGEEEDLVSTAESSSTKKRSFSEIQCAVPSSCFSSAHELDSSSFKPHDSNKSRSVRLRPEPDGSSVQEVRTQSLRFIYLFPVFTFQLEFVYFFP